MRRLIIGMVLGFLLATGIIWAKEVIVDFTDSSLPILNEELRDIRRILIDHEARIVVLEP
jgi:hypothetical protein